MKISRIEHIGIAVQSIEEVLPYYKDVLGLEVYKEEVVEDQKVKTAFLQVGEVKLELLEPTCPESTIQKLRDRNPISWANIAQICDLLNCQPDYFLENTQEGAE